MSQFDFELLLSRELASFNGSKRLLDSIQYSLLSAGKRIRPKMVFASAKAVDLDFKQAAHIAVSLEMIHCFTLIHDDLPCMDNDDLRRGIPTNHKKFGESTALLAGDALIPMAIEIFSKLSSHTDPHFFSDSLQYFCKMMGPEGVMGGQAEEAELLAHPSYEKLIEVFKGKTGALFSAALTLPALIKGASQETVHALKRNGIEYGIVFQILDDLEDPNQKNATSILNYKSFDVAYSDAEKRLNSISSSLQSVFSQKNITQLNEIHMLFEKKLQACKK